ncbi:hypothetical protein CLAFUW4_05513 [Fulvia fulva]|uniref:PHD-type domain-containing protein n=1 Tax=Passalora fulva TaxID=5499 RepID=A0A9Q8LHY1_PASFU|nr:uncharacterized protein CLAFUR5_05654 [Fulvia fulva]KAK4624528.1 hypothetical protein CLAFUR4_05507 [Fulvia fulva]KAK4624967.1 hypothetical protein CLAFUR0_05515 [Fulvia fulva]UJO17718.1 hypothetical protein CLAFUR5_05654 [Fulvia fulva]WPV14788.1 hypothetical protein CLAFUW4_05513 [Fulvia fulva]WPV30227.1 hypothetical protein CLAFUW7_05511 [Fulvia fulva]
MTARTVAIKSRQAAAQDALLDDTSHDPTPVPRSGFRIRLSKPPPRVDSPPADDDSVSEDDSIQDATESVDHRLEKDHWAEGLVCFSKYLASSKARASRQPEGYNDSLIACDGPCEEWYHDTCVNVTFDEAESIETFICPICVGNGYGRTIWKKAATSTAQDNGTGANENEEIALAGFPRVIPVQRKREHRALSLKVVGIVRAEAKRKVRWQEGRGPRGLGKVGISG